MADARDHELRIARGAIRELEQKIFSQEQALAVLRASVACYQRDIEDPPAYLKDAVIRAAGLGAMAEELAALKKALTAAPAQPTPDARQPLTFEEWWESAGPNTVSVYEAAKSTWEFLTVHGITATTGENKT